MELEKYSLGIGDRFGQQGIAQLKALIRAKERGVDLVPVWNKSHREHQIVGTTPEETLREAESAVNALKWRGAYYVDADHITQQTVEPYVEHANFFTLDVADHIGSEISKPELEHFLKEASSFEGKFEIPGIPTPFRVNEGQLVKMAGKFLGAVREAAAIYRYIADRKGADHFVSEVSMDEVEEAQSPVELFFILLMLRINDLPLQTIAPKFTGRFNKGVDYAGDPDHFRKEFEEVLLVIDYAVKTFGLPSNLKLSVHSGSDKFTIYPVMGELIRKYDKGIHVKTAGTTWLEEVIGLAMTGGKALQMAKNIYYRAYERQDELFAPYASVIDVDPASLPKPDVVAEWTGVKFANTLRHIPGHPNYHPGFRQLIHVAYKVAAELGETYLDMVRTHEEVVGDQVAINLYRRHIRRLFIDKTKS